MQPISVQFVFHGRVQGVGFRATARQHAQDLGLTGWVRNQRDGTVLLVVEGASEEIDELMSRIEASLGAGVTGIDREKAPPQDEFSGFRILRG